VLDRVHPAETQHTVKVQHDVTPGFKETAEIMERIASLAARYNVPRIVEGKTIESEPRQ
jgi:hypothetical protein